MAKKTAKPRAKKKAPPAPVAEFDSYVESLNTLGGGGLWELGRYIAEVLVPSGKAMHWTEKQLLERVASHPKARYPFKFLNECLLFYHTYPDVRKRPLPENFYFDLAVRLTDDELRRQYEQRALHENWAIEDLRKAIREGLLEKRERRRTDLEFDLQITNVWSFDVPDPRFGKSQHKGRIPGQVIANALYYYAPTGGVVLDPFAGDGTLGDVIDKLECFRSLTYRMYDKGPSDSRIIANDVLLQGFPVETASVDYVFLNPPSLDSHRASTFEATELTEMDAESFLTRMRSMVREAGRVLKSGGRVSIIVEGTTSRPFLDLPRSITAEFEKAGFEQIGKVYLLSHTVRGGSLRTYLLEKVKAGKVMLSECRELLTFEKPSQREKDKGLLRWLRT